LSNFDIQEYVFESFINENSAEENEDILKNVQQKGQLFQFLNWVKIKSKGCDEFKQQKIIESILIYSKNLPHKKGMFWGIGSDLTTVLHYASDMLYDINDIEVRRKLILSHLESNVSFASFYLGDRILYANDQSENGKLYSSNEWYYLFKFEKESDLEFIEKILSKRNSIAIELFDKILIESEFLAEDEIGLILDTVYKSYKEHYEANFDKLIENDHDLVKYVWLSIKRSWMTSNSRVGYQLAEYQFYPGIDKEVVKNRFDNLNSADFDENENKVISLFQKAYEDGFEEKKYYDIENLEEMGRW